MRKSIHGLPFLSYVGMGLRSRAMIATGADTGFWRIGFEIRTVEGTPLCGGPRGILRKNCKMEVCGNGISGILRPSVIMFHFILI